MNGILALSDTETTTLARLNNPGEIISAAVILVDMLTLEEISDDPNISRGLWYMHPRYPDLADPMSLKINGYTHEKWSSKGTVTHEMFVPAFLSVISKAVFFAQNVCFDRFFYNLEIQRHNAQSQRSTTDEYFTPSEWTGHYHSYDLSSVGLPLLWAGKIQKLSLQSLCDYYGIERHDKHDAFGDCMDMLQVLRAHRNYFGYVISLDTLPGVGG
jgi:DNA polymerase III epsilon subunit-like protein